VGAGAEDGEEDDERGEDEEATDLAAAFGGFSLLANVWRAGL
jgi:hypothetical protein